MKTTQFSTLLLHALVLLITLPLTSFSCVDGEEHIREWEAQQYKYLWTSYYRPKSIHVYLKAGNEWAVTYAFDNAIYDGNNAEAFRKLALSFGQDGTKLLPYGSQMDAKPYGMKQLRLWKKEGEQRSDISDQVLLVYNDSKDFILSGYQGLPKVAIVNLGQLTAEQLLWMPGDFRLNFQPSPGQVYIIEMTLDDGTVLTNTFS